MVVPQAMWNDDTCVMGVKLILFDIRVIDNLSSNFHLEIIWKNLILLIMTSENEYRTLLSSSYCGKHVIFL